MTTIYLSSTYEDLKDYRSAVFEALRKAYKVLAMEDYVATDRRPVEKCLADVAEADIYVGLFAFRYGYVPPAEHANPDGLSITELELRYAERLAKPCLAFVLSEDAPWPPRFIDRLNGEHINRLREHLLTEKTASFFSSPHQLASLVQAAVTKHLSEKFEQAGGINQQDDQSSIAVLVFDPSSSKHVQRGNMRRQGAGVDQACEEYKYAIGVINLSSKPISCQLVLDHSDPHNTAEQRLEVPLRVRGQPPESDGKFTLAPGNKQQPTAYVEVLQELVLKSNPMNEHAIIRLIYANSADGRANWFQDHRDHILTFRLQGDMAKPVAIKLSVRSENRRYVVSHLA
jgi:hypothetical protein